MRSILTLCLVLLGAAPVAAQWVVYDPANTARNAISATIKEYLLAVQRSQRAQIDQMSHRLSRLTDLGKYSLPDAPKWRIHDLLDEGISPLARDYYAALNYGDSQGRALLAISHQVTNTAGLLNRLSPAALRTVAARLATIDATEAVLIAGTNDAGLTRYNGRRELEAIEALEAHVIDDSDEQSTTAVLEKLSGASLIGTRQRQARIQLLASVVEQLVMDSKRTRDADAGAMNMQLVTWRDGRAANDAFVAGTSDALRTWRQP